MRQNSRITRINDELLREIAEIIRSDLKDPRAGTIVSVLETDTSPDLKHCRVYVSVLGDDKVKNEAMEALTGAKGFIRKLLAERVNLRVTPELNFILDSSMEHGFRISKLIDEVVKDLPKESGADFDEN